jgi:hypothetical protein
LLIVASSPVGPRQADVPIELMEPGPADVQRNG